MEESLETRAQKLADTIRDQDVDASLKLLESAGDACQARAMAKEAKRTSYNDHRSLFVDYSVTEDLSAGKETLTMYLMNQSNHPGLPAVGITQERCKYTGVKEEGAW